MCKTIKQRVKLKADPATVYDLLADSRKLTALTGRQAIISRKIGGTFTIGESDVTGINVDLVPGRRIVQAWRHRRFPEGIFSMAAVTLTRAREFEYRPFLPATILHGFVLVEVAEGATGIHHCRMRDLFRSVRELLSDEPIGVHPVRTSHNAAC
jgi:uncharacterized protein YndB with AHSA1/START domain